MAIEKRTTNFKCYRCSGKKYIKIQGKQQQCPVCKGTGTWKEDTYYFINDKTKICFDGDGLK